MNHQGFSPTLFPIVLSPVTFYGSVSDNKSTIQYSLVLYHRGYILLFLYPYKFFWTTQGRHIFTHGRIRQVYESCTDWKFLAGFSLIQYSSFLFLSRTTLIPRILFSFFKLFTWQTSPALYQICWSVGAKKRTWRGEKRNLDSCQNYTKKHGKKHHIQMDWMEEGMSMILPHSNNL